MLDPRTIIIRPARLAEATALRALQAASLRGLGTPSYGAAAIEAFIAHGTLPEELIAEGRYAVAEVAGRLVGCGGWSATTPGYAPLLSSPAGAAPPVVRAVYVHPEAARQGVGRALMGWIERAMVAAGHARATLLATLPGLPLYRRLGWRDGERVVLRLPCGAALPAVGMDKALVVTGAGQLQAA